MAPQLDIAIEAGPKKKRYAAFAPAWPGLERGGVSQAAAVDALREYVPRYAAVAELAGRGRSFPKKPDVQVVERFTGTGSTDFWGISFAFSRSDHEQLTRRQLDRELGLMRACWSYFDGVRARVSTEMRKGPRGGGRDRDRIVRHVLAVEQDWAKKLGIRVPADTVITRPTGLAQFRDDYCGAIGSLHAEDEMARTWPLRYLIRHTAYHALDHAWEMEDKDLTRA